MENRQPTPRMQLVSILFSVEGFASNIADGNIYTEEQVRDRAVVIEERIKEAQKILKDMPEGEWK